MIRLGSRTISSDILLSEVPINPSLNCPRGRVNSQTDQSSSHLLSVYSSAYSAGSDSPSPSPRDFPIQKVHANASLYLQVGILRGTYASIYREVTAFAASKQSSSCVGSQLRGRRATERS